MPVLPASGAFYHETASAQFAALLRLQDHLPRRAVLHGLAGFINSALPRMVQLVASEARLSLIRGVLPMVLTMSSYTCMRKARLTTLTKHIRNVAGRTTYGPASTVLKPPAMLAASAL